MRRGAQRPHMHVEFVGQDLKRQPILLRPSCLERLCSADDGRWRTPSAGIPRAERFDRDAKRYRALCLGQTEPRPNLSQDRGGLGHSS